jgi:UDP-2,3-diacylglucosamine pyrophosphatase LpxH
MLVIASDLHLTDLPSSVRTDMSRLLSRIRALAALNKERGLDPMRVALLGDIFDLLHSQKWITNGVRPWETATDLHRATVRDIYLDIKRYHDDFFHGLRDLKSDYADLQLFYIPGNHDRVINIEMGDLARARLHEDIPFEADGHNFQDTLIFHEYRTIGRHGHELDPRNIYAMERAAIGDFIVIDILEKLPNLIASAMELNNVSSRGELCRPARYSNDVCVDI